MKTSPARWYRDPQPQVDGWPLHRPLGAQEPAMAAVVEPFRKIILGGPPRPSPYVEPRPLDFDDFLNGYATATTGKPWRDMPVPIGFRCPDCGAKRSNPEAVHPTYGFRSICNHVVPKLCDACTPRYRSPYLRDRLADMPVFRDRDRLLPMRPKARCSKTTALSLPTASPGDDGLPAFIGWLPRVGDLEFHRDDSIPDGVIEIDGTRIALAEMQAVCEGS